MPEWRSSAHLPFSLTAYRTALASWLAHNRLGATQRSVAQRLLPQESPIDSQHDLFFFSRNQSLSSRLITLSLSLPSTLALFSLYLSPSEDNGGKVSITQR